MTRWGPAEASERVQSVGPAPTSCLRKPWSWARTLMERCRSLKPRRKQNWARTRRRRARALGAAQVRSSRPLLPPERVLQGRRLGSWREPPLLPSWECLQCPSLLSGGAPRPPPRPLPDVHLRCRPPTRRAGRPPTPHGISVPTWLLGVWWPAARGQLPAHRPARTLSLGMPPSALTGRPGLPLCVCARRPRAVPVASASPRPLARDCSRFCLGPRFPSVESGVSPLSLLSLIQVFCS